MIGVSVPLRTGRGLNDRKHWAARARTVKAEKDAVRWMLNGHPKPILPCVITLTRCAPSNGLDGDNLQGSMKASRDAVAEWIGVDDADPRIAWRYSQRREKSYSVEVQIA